jgi:UDP-N-acetylmuramoylalanine--D-glutamate ligase
MIDLSFLKGKTVAVLGLGKTGLPSALALAKSGAEVLAWDDNPVSRDQAERNGLKLTDLNISDLDDTAFLLLSPGIPHTFPEPNPTVARFKALDIPLLSDIELLRQADPAAKIVAITGTNGKSTTTALIGHILAGAGRKVQVGGNLGPAVLAFEQLGANGIYVLELSSYQLELTPSLKANIAILLNITPDHLDRHGGMEGYVAAKANIFRGAKTAIVGIDDQFCRGIAEQLSGQLASPLPGERVLSLSPQGLGAVGEGQRQDKSAVVDTANEDGPPLTRSPFGRPTSPLGEVITLSLDEPTSTITFTDGQLHDHRSNFKQSLDFPALPGPHNAQNAAAAYAACLSLGLSTAQIRKGMASFPGLAHRQQRIATVDGIVFINDSKATNADAAAKALACYETIYWIAGGQPKAGGLDGLEELMPRVRHAFLIGEAANAFGSWLAGKVAYSHCGTLDRAVAAAYDMVASDNLPGAVVLLSPACASWDQFQSFEHRGQVFTDLVQTLAKEAAA